MSLAATIAAVVILLAASWWLTHYDDPRPLWLDAVPWPRLPRPRLPRLSRVRRRRRDGGRLAWKLWGLACKHPRVCPANAHSALIWHTRPLREIFIDWTCRSDLVANGGTCWCGKLRATDPGTAPLPPAGGGPGQDPPRAHGTRRVTTEHWAASGRHHASAPLALAWDANRGRYCHAETGPIAIPDGYGVIGEGTAMTAVDRMWRGLP